MKTNTPPNDLSYTPERASLESFPAPPYTAYVLTDVFEDAKRLFLDALIEVDYAHAVMLAEQRIITRDELRVLIPALENLDRALIQAKEYDGSHEDLFFYLEDLITQSCGADVAGRLHTARSRNDTDVTIYRMRLRADALRALRAMMDLRRVMLGIVDHHYETVIPAYTHTQPAQPTTLAHYVLAMAEVLGRDIKRMQRAVENVNRSPLGACAITTTGFPINRHRTSQLLGFDAPTVNSYASIGAVDYLTETLSVVVITMTDIGRFVQEFLSMASREFDGLRLSDGYVQTSSIMPQKRNPVALEHVRVLASKALGEANAAFVCVHNTPFGDINDVEDDLQPLVFNATRDAARALGLFAAALSTATFNVETLRRRAREGFITVTELADVIVRREGLPFRAAHQIVATFVHKAQINAEGYEDEVEDLSAVSRLFDLLQAVADDALGRPLNLSFEDMRDALDPEHFVRVRNVLGGPAPDEARRAATVEREHERADEEWYAIREATFAAYPRQLRAAFEALMVDEKTG